MPRTWAAPEQWRVVITQNGRVWGQRGPYPKEGTAKSVASSLHGRLRKTEPQHDWNHVLQKGTVTWETV